MQVKGFFSPRSISPAPTLPLFFLSTFLQFRKIAASFSEIKTFPFSLRSSSSQKKKTQQKMCVSSFHHFPSRRRGSAISRSTSAFFGWAADLPLPRAFGSAFTLNDPLLFGETRRRAFCVPLFFFTFHEGRYRTCLSSPHDGFFFFSSSAGFPSLRACPLTRPHEIADSPPFLFYGAPTLPSCATAVLSLKHTSRWFFTPAEAFLPTVFWVNPVFFSPPKQFSFFRPAYEPYLSPLFLRRL